ncbi:hypothetical protein DP73_03150 [Desulfosporosinus sp. HMP52]|uniref:hypothetical protein n=1 Tax=Desulfosporosinus sp. HMP52 TaxID=1487923 RepID=UPI00051FBC47|nr:hypothetical protein [Desulfosporosinus sp. HMP52]KGK91433.1 hypothetical protein DP73_03150 [Desulfosporosinus sp. HMP52]
MIVLNIFFLITLGVAVIAGFAKYGFILRGRFSYWIVGGLTTILVAIIIFLAVMDNSILFPYFID